MRYPVTVVRDTNDTFLVTFPDVPGAVTYGETTDEALTRATDALLSIFDALIKDRQEIPEPSDVGSGLSVVVPALEATKICLYREMRAEKVGKAELGRRLNVHLPQVDRLLDVHHGSQLNQLEAAFHALGKRLEVTVLDQAPLSGATVKKVLAQAKRAGSMSRADVARTAYAGRVSGRATIVRRAAKKR